MAEAEQLLKDPARLTAEYQRRLTEACHPPAGRDSSVAALAAQIAKLRRGVGRLIDSYAEGTIEKAEFEPRVRSLKERVARLEEQHQALIDGAALQATLSLIIGRLEDFARTVQSRLAELDWTGKRELIRTLVKRVEIGLEEVNVVFRVAPVAAGPQPTGSGTDPGLGSHSLQDCRGRGKAAFGQIARQREINSLAEGSVVLPPGMLEFVSKSSTSKEEVQSGKMNGIGPTGSSRSTGVTPWRARPRGSWTTA